MFFLSAHLKFNKKIVKKNTKRDNTKYQFVLKKINQLSASVVL